MSTNLKKIPRPIAIITVNRWIWLILGNINIENLYLPLYQELSFDSQKKKCYKDSVSNFQPSFLFPSLLFSCLLRQNSQDSRWNELYETLESYLKNNEFNFFFEILQDICYCSECIICTIWLIICLRFESRFELEKYLLLIQIKEQFNL